MARRIVRPMTPEELRTCPEQSRRALALALTRAPAMQCDFRDFSDPHPAAKLMKLTTPRFDLPAPLSDPPSRFENRPIGRSFRLGLVER